MKPDVNKIFAKLKAENPKTELESQNVELALIDDAKAAIKEAQKMMTIIEKDGSQYLDLHQKIQNNGDRLMSIFSFLQDSERKLEKAEKDLGISLPEVSKLDKVMNDILRMRKRYTF